MKIVFASDISFNYMGDFRGKAAAVTAMAEPAAIFARADFSMINLENVLGRKEDGEPIVKSGPNLIAEDSFAEYVHALKPNIVGLANNHAKDYGEGILFHTIQMLTDSDYACIGAGRNIKEAYLPAKVEHDGVRAAIIAVCENEFGIATETESGTAGYSLGCVTEAIHQAIADGCKPIVYFHGGNEWNPFPSPGKVELYRHFIDLGAEAVIGMHTHCPQGYEFYKGKPIVYSMGNFFFPAKNRKSISWFYGYMSELDIEQGSIRLAIHPYRFDYDGVTMLKGSEREEFMLYMEQLNKPIGDVQELQRLFDSWCLTSGYTAELAQFKAEYISDGCSEKVKVIKNILCCEAHSELVKNTLRMIFESRLGIAADRVEYIKSLQNMQIVPSCMQQE